MKKTEAYLFNEIDQVIDLLFAIKNQKNLMFSKLCDEGVKTIKKKGKIIFFGNGGSAADAQHLATELTCKFKIKRNPLPGIALTTDSSALTAIGRRGDLASAITTSGNSKNLIEAAKTSKRKGIKIFSLSGNKGGRIKNYVDGILNVPSKIPSQIQVAEILIGQMFCGYLEEFFFKKK